MISRGSRSADADFAAEPPPVFQRAQMPFIIWGAISPKITEQNLPNVTRVTPTLVNENRPLAEAIIADGKVQKIARLAKEQGTRIDVTVSAMGDATSLQGGTLLVTPLLGAVYR